MSTNTEWWSPETLRMIEKLKTSLVAARTANLGDPKVLLDILSSPIDEFDALAPQTKTQVMLIFMTTIMTWIDHLARQPDTQPPPPIHLYYFT